MSLDRGFDLSEAPGSYMPGQGKNHLLAIGIDEYHSWPKLQNAVKDAREFADVLVRQYQFEASNIHLLLDQEATESNIYEKLREIKKGIGEHDNLIIYYSGHGFYDEDFDEGSWVPVDAEPEKFDRYISNANIIRRVNAIACQHLLMIVDSCFSGSLVVRKRNAVIDERFKSKRILASGRIESVTDGSPGKNSPFAEGILTYLRKNTQLAVNTTSLVQYVKDFVAGKANQTPVEGRINNSDDEGGEFVFRLRRSEAELWVEVTAKDTQEAYNDYLAAFKDGLYAAQARNRLLVLREEETWQNALNTETELGFENYIARYAGIGKYLEEARNRLEQLKARREAQLKARQEMAEEENKRENMKQHYASLVQAAEGLFQKKDLANARDKYRDALLNYLPGFAPNQDYLEEQISFCSTSISFLENYDQGINAMRQGNYRLAIPYFEEALSLTENAKAESLLRECRMHVNRQGAGQPPPVAPPPVKRPVQHQPQQTRSYQQPVSVAPQKKKSGGLLKTVIVLGVLGILIAAGAAIYDELDLGRSSGSYNSSFTDPPDDTDDNTNFSKTKETPVDPTTQNYNLIQGEWFVDDITVNGYPITNYLPQFAYLIGASYTFHNNNAVIIRNSLGTSNSTYSIINYNISFNSFGAVSNGQITHMDDKYLDINFPFTDLYGNYYETKWSLSR